MSSTTFTPGAASGAAASGNAYTSHWFSATTRPPANPTRRKYLRGAADAGIATLTVGSLISGALEIYGTTSPLIVVYWIAGAALTLLGGLLFFTRVIREQGRAA